MNDSELCRKIVKNKLDPMSMYTQLRFMKNSFVIACLVMGTVVPSIVQAQSAESLDKRITAVEKQLNAVQRRVFRGETGAGTQMSPRPDVTATGVSLADMQARIAEIETQLRILTGQVEESNYRFNRLQQQYEKFTQDVEFRFTALEKNKGTAAAGSDHTQPPSGGTENVTAEVHVSPPVDITVADNHGHGPYSLQKRPIVTSTVTVTVTVTGIAIKWGKSCVGHTPGRRGGGEVGGGNTATLWEKFKLGG